MNRVWEIRYTAILSCLIFLLVACYPSPKHKENIETGQHVEDTTVENDTLFNSFAAQESKFSDWKNIYAEKGAAFSIDSFTYNNEYSSELLVTDMPLNKKFYKRYGKLIVYNKDSSRFIDPFSYMVDIEIAANGKLKSLGTEADQEVAVVDVKKQKRYRILFCGPSCFVAKATWLNDNNIALFGITMEEETDSTIPTIWLVNIAGNTITEYSYDAYTGSITPDDILDSILTAKGIAAR